MTPDLNINSRTQEIGPHLIVNQEVTGMGNWDSSKNAMKTGNRNDQELQINTIAGFERKTFLTDKFHHSLNVGEHTLKGKDSRVSGLFSPIAIKKSVKAFEEVCERLDEKTRDVSSRSLITAEKASEILNICYDSFIHLVEYNEIPIEKRDGKQIFVLEGRVYEYKKKQKKIREKNLEQMVKSDSELIEFD